MTGTPLWACWLAVGLSAGALIGIVWLSARRTARVVDALAVWAQQVSVEDLAQEVPSDTSEQLGKLSRALAEMLERLRESAEGHRQLEEELRTELEQRGRLSETIFQAGQIAANATEQQVLLESIAEQLATRWPRYTIALYLSASEWAPAALGAVAGTEKRGGSPLRERATAGDGTTVGRCLATGEVTAWPETDERSRPFGRLFQTGARSELAVPLRSRGRVLGAISVHSDRLEPFAPEFVAAVETIGHHVASALENLRLAQVIQETEAGLGTHETSTGQAWQELLRTRGSWGYRYAGGQVEATGPQWPAEMRKALATGQLVPACADHAEGEIGLYGTLAIPVKVRDQVVGVLGFRKAEGTPLWTQRETQVLQVVAGELGEALVSAQLYDAAQSNAVRQQVVAELSSRMRQTLDIEAVLRTAAAEVREALGLSEVVVRLRQATSVADDGQDVTPDEAGASRAR